MKQYNQVVEKINGLEKDISALSDADLKGQTAKFRERLDAGEKLDALLPEAFATMREAGKRVMGMRHFDVQLIGGMTLHDGQIAEMRTGEGKTLVCTLPGYLNALPGNNVHIVTVNDYLARRDSEWMGRLYKFLGMEVGLIQNGQRPQSKIGSYKADVTYGTNSEFGFDYLRDNMVGRADMRVQRGHTFCVVDEVDSILIDEARTPLIISGAGQQAADTYKAFAAVMPGLVEDVDFEKDESKRTIIATEVGLTKIENALGIEDIYSDPSGQLANHLQQALRAQFLFHRDVDYVVLDGEVKIVDEFTGRIMEGRRWSEGLHQAVEAKEHVKVNDENQTLATITLQNYFRLYDKLSGMTGTAMTEDSEFRQIYKLPVVAIPPNKPVARVDENDQIYRTVEAKFNAVADDIAARNEKGQPCLVGTVSIENSERLSRLLDKRGIKHETLNAKNHEREANIVAQAGRKGAVTIATNMAGRGTDILLGGNAEVMAENKLREMGYDPTLELDAEVEAGQPGPAPKAAREAALEGAQAVCNSEREEVRAIGGLCVIGTERHESRRIDNQLRGRAGRQGDPGSTQFYLSLEDDLMRLFGGDNMLRVSRWMEKADVPDSMPIQNSMVTKAIESSQRQVESMHFAARKNVLEYDDVMNLQRKAIYEERNAILDGKDMTDKIDEIIRDAADRIVVEYCPKTADSSEDWDLRGVNTWVTNLTGTEDFDATTLDLEDSMEALSDAIVDYVSDCYQAKADMLGAETMKMLQGQIMLRIIDTRWMAHLTDMDYLKTGIGLRAYGHRDPLVEYKNEAFKAFEAMTTGLYEDFLRTLLRLQLAVQVQVEEPQPERKMSYSNPEGDLTRNDLAAAERRAGAAGAGGAAAAAGAQGMPAEAPKPNATGKGTPIVKDKEDPYANCGRNDPCPCGSGKKFKKCHGANLE